MVNHLLLEKMAKRHTACASTSFTSNIFRKLTDHPVVVASWRKRHKNGRVRLGRVLTFLVATGNSPAPISGKNTACFTHDANYTLFTTSKS